MRYSEQRHPSEAIGIATGHCNSDSFSPQAQVDSIVHVMLIDGSVSLTAQRLSSNDQSRHRALGHRLRFREVTGCPDSPDGLCLSLSLDYAGIVPARHSGTVDELGERVLYSYSASGETLVSVWSIDSLPTLARSPAVTWTTGHGNRHGSGERRFRTLAIVGFAREREALEQEARLLDAGLDETGLASSLLKILVRDELSVSASTVAALLAEHLILTMFADHLTSSRTARLRVTMLARSTELLFRLRRSTWMFQLPPRNIRAPGRPSRQLTRVAVRMLKYLIQRPLRSLLLAASPSAYENAVLELLRAAEQRTLFVGQELSNLQGRNSPISENDVLGTYSDIRRALVGEIDGAVRTTLQTLAILLTLLGLAATWYYRLRSTTVGN